VELYSERELRPFCAIGYVIRPLLAVPGAFEERGIVVTVGCGPLPDLGVGLNLR